MPDVTITIRAENLASGETKKLQIDIANLRRAFNETDTAAKGFGQRLSAIQPHLQGIASGANVFAANMFGLGKGFVDAALKMEGFKTALTNIEGNAAAAEKRFAELQKVAQLPGLSLAGVVQGAARLKSIGVEAELADRTLKEFGNALALVGSTDLSGALQGLTRLVSKGKVVTQDLQQITDRAPQITQALQNIFNTTQADEIQKQLDASGQSVKDFVNILVTELERGARAAEGPTTSALSNLKNAIFDLQASLGETLLPAVTSVAKALKNFVDGFNSLGDGTKNAIVALAAVGTGATALVGGFATLGIAITGIKAGLAALGISATAAGIALKAALGPIGIAAGIIGGAIAAYHALARSKRDAAQASKELEEAQKKELEAFEQAAKAAAPGQAVLNLRIAETAEELANARAELEALRHRSRQIGGHPSRRATRNLAADEIKEQIQVVENLEKAFENLQRSRRQTDIQLNAQAVRYLKTTREQLAAKLYQLRVDKATIKARETRSGRAGEGGRRKKAEDLRNVQAEIQSIIEQVESTEKSIAAIEKTKKEEAEKRLKTTSDELTTLTQVETTVKSTAEISTEVQESLKAQAASTERVVEASKKVVKNRKSELELLEDSFIVLNGIAESEAKLRVPTIDAEIPRTPVQGVRPDKPTPTAERDPLRGSQDDPNNKRATVARPTAPGSRPLYQKILEQQEKDQQEALQKEKESLRAQYQQNKEHNEKLKQLYEERKQLIQPLVDTIAAVPADLFSATFDSIVRIPAEMQDALNQLNQDTAAEIAAVRESQLLNAREKAEQIAQIEQDAAKRRMQIEKEANQAKIDGFKSVVDNFIGGIGQMIAEQIKLRAATALTNALLGSPGQSGGGGGGIGGILGSALPFLGALNPALAIGGGLALGAAALFSSSFDDPINDALARRAGIQASQRRASRAAVALGRRSAVDLRDNFEQGFVTETTRQTGAQEESSNPVIMNEIKLVIGSQELKAMYEETQRQITTGIIAR